MRIVRMQLIMMQEKYLFIIVRLQRNCSRLIRINVMGSIYNEAVDIYMPAAFVYTGCQERCVQGLHLIYIIKEALFIDSASFHVLHLWARRWRKSMNNTNI